MGQSGQLSFTQSSTFLSQITHILSQGAVPIWTTVGDAEYVFSEWNSANSGETPVQIYASELKLVKH